MDQKDSALKYFNKSIILDALGVKNLIDENLTDDWFGRGVGAFYWLILSISILFGSPYL